MKVESSASWQSGPQLSDLSTTPVSQPQHLLCTVGRQRRIVHLRGSSRASHMYGSTHTA